MKVKKIFSYKIISHRQLTKQSKSIRNKYTGYHVIKCLALLEDSLQDMDSNSMQYTLYLKGACNLNDNTIQIISTSLQIDFVIRLQNFEFYKILPDSTYT